MSEPVLCYIEGPWAYFTTRPLADQCGDDWDDAPYEHNAGWPYKWHKRDGLGCKCFHPDGYTIYSGKGPDGRRAPCGEEGHKPKPPVERWEVVRVAWDGPFETPADRAGCNSRYSVEDINSGAVAWLVGSAWDDPTPPPIPAGTTLSEFKRAMRAAGGNVYVEETDE